VPSFVTIAIPFDAARLDAVRAKLEAWGNPASEALRAKLEPVGQIHFMSGNGFADAASAWLILEASSDASEAETIARLALSLEDEISDLLETAGKPVAGSTLGEVLSRGRLSFGCGWFQTPGLMFCGTPGLDSQRIRNEAALAAHIEPLVTSQTAPGGALASLERIRQELRAQGSWDWAFEAAPAALLEGAPASSVPGDILAALPGVARYFLWPFLAMAALVAVVDAVLRWPARGAAPDILHAVAHGVGMAVIVALGLSLLFAGWVYFSLRRAETKDAPDDTPPAIDLVDGIMARENRTAQNHLFAVSTMKPEWFRPITMRLVLFVAGLATTRVFRPGFLGPLGTIHYARFLRLKGTDKLLFLSNYGGSWQAYLEDFIVQASVGLTGVWSNTLGFPRTNNLVLGGSVDGDRFKRWARRQQLPTSFWYSAYPGLSTAGVRINAAIRRGLAEIATEDDARDWLSLFGSAPAPVSEIDTASVQTLALGGLGRVPFAAFLFGQASQDPSAARAWLGELRQRVVFGADHLPAVALNVAFTSTGLTRLSLTAAQMATFPAAFQDGMAAPWRSRALGDVDASVPEGWRWGGTGKPVDFALLVYATASNRLAEAVAAELERLERFDGALVALVNTPELPPPNQSSPEPFGFEDGLSQPRIRGLRPTTAADVDHIVEAGELLLGYPDNSGYLPPTPQAAAVDDPERLLPGLPDDPTAQKPDFSRHQPNAPRDLGRNGTFLVVRQLQQDVAGYRTATVRAAQALHESGDAPVAQRDLTEWVAAKTVGRWRNGDPLVLHPTLRPFDAATDENDFRYGALDPAGTHCPFGAHIRRANPRDSFGADSPTQIVIVNRHRILRIGRPYQPQSEGDDPGLLFMCVNADIERQFEFLQQSWIGNRSFNGLRDEADPLLGHGQGVSGALSVPRAAGTLRLEGFKDFVTVLGGGYFFLPSRQALNFLSA
jgi:Dyp-type peroxidase family